MIRGIHSLMLALVAVVLASMSACGQTGPLTLPDETASGEEVSNDEENER